MSDQAKGQDMGDEQFDSGSTTNLKGNLIVIGACLALLPIALLLLVVF